MVMGSWPVVVLLLLLVWTVVVTVLLFRLIRQRAHQASQLASISSDMRALCGAAVNVGERINAIERGQRSLDRRQDELGHRQEQIGTVGDSEQSYDQAIKMMKKGASTEELVDICGLSRGEAELVAMMQRLGGEESGG